MKIKTLLSALVLILFMSSCSFYEKIQFQKDGSGTYEVKMDADAILNNPMFADKAEEAKEKENPEYRDTVIYFKDIPVEERKGLAKSPHFQNVSIRVHMDEAKNEMYMSLSKPFKSLNELNSFIKDFAELKENNDKDELLAFAEDKDSSGMDPVGMASILGVPAEMGGAFEMSKKGLLSRPKVEMDKIPGMDDMGEEEEQMLEMMKMFAEEGKMVTEIQLPGKVKKHTFKNARIDGKTVFIENTFLDLLEMRIDMSGEVKYK